MPTVLNCPSSGAAVPAGIRTEASRLPSGAQIPTMCDIGIPLPVSSHQPKPVTVNGFSTSNSQPTLWLKWLADPPPEGSNVSTGSAKTAQTAATKQPDRMMSLIAGSSFLLIQCE